MKKGIFYGWWIVLSGLLMITITVPFTSALVGLYLLPVTEEFGIPRSAFTFTTTIIAICGIILSPIVGKIIRKYSVKFVLSTSLIIFALAYMSYGLAQSVYHLYISAFFIGLAFPFCGNLSTQIIIVNWFEKSRGLALSIAIAGIGLGGFIFGPVIANLLLNFGWRQTYFIMGIAILAIGLPIVLFLIKRSPEDKGLQPYGAGEVNQAVTGKAQIEIDITPEEAKKEPFFYLFMLGVFALGLLTTGSLQNVSPYVADAHGTAFAATIVAIFSGVGVFTKIFMGQMSDKIGVLKAGNLGYLALMASFILLLFGGNKTILIIAAVVLALGNAVAAVSLPLFATNIFGDNNAGLMMGLANSAFQVGMALGGVLTGAIFDLSGSYVWAWISLTTVALLSMISISMSYAISRKKFAPHAVKKDV